MFFPDDLASIMEDIVSIKTEYQQLGSHLRLHEPDITAIIMQKHHNIWLCLRDVINTWLNMNTIGSKKPNRRLLVEAIKKINPKLATTLEDKYKS